MDPVEGRDDLLLLLRLERVERLHRVRHALVPCPVPVAVEGEAALRRDLADKAFDHAAVGAREDDMRLEVS